ncbi:MAG: hypothetical protein NVS3B15_07790 [Sediminibacterium sp.]
MTVNKTALLSTRPVKASLVASAGAKGIQLDILSFIETEAIRNVQVQQEVELALVQLATVVFTSMNAVEAVIDLLDGHIPDWRIYCMGHTTRDLIEKYFGEAAIAGTAGNALELADAIIEDNAADEVIFFCGNQRRAELPDRLLAHDILVNEVVVYQTIAMEHTVDKKYDGIVFFSPTAVTSFFKHNTLPGTTIVFAIGSTTKAAIGRYCPNRIIVSDSPAKDKLVEQAIDYFERSSTQEKNYAAE